MPDDDRPDESSHGVPRPATAAARGRRTSPTEVQRSARGAMEEMMAAETETYVPMIEFDEEDLAEFIRRRREEQDARSKEEAVARSLEWHRAAPGRFPERFLAAVGRAGSSPPPPRRAR